MKIELNNVIESLKKAKLPSETIQVVVKNLHAAIEEEKAKKEEDSHDKKKKQFVVVASDPEAKFKGIDLVGWVVQIEDTSNPASIFDRIKAAGHAFNVSRKGKLSPVKKMAEVFEVVARRFWQTKESENTLVKTKTPVQILFTDGKI